MQFTNTDTKSYFAFYVETLLKGTIPKIFCDFFKLHDESVIIS